VGSKSSDSGKTQAVQAQRAAVSTPADSLSVWERLKQHKVAQWMLAYAAAAYTLLHGTEMVSRALEWPHLLVRVVTLLLFLGLPLVLPVLGHATWHLYRKVVEPDLSTRPRFSEPRPKARRYAADFPASLFPARRDQP
jgi:hypothetical protein